MAGRSPWYIAYRRLRSNPYAIGSLVVFIAIVVFCLAAPLWARDVAHTGPNATHTLEKVEVEGEQREVVSPSGKAIGPLWFGASGRFFLGADGRLGRDEMVRLMYGGITSLEVSFAAALITTLLAVVLGLLCAYYRGWTDTLISRAMDVIWAIPVLLLGIALGVASNAGNGLGIGPITIPSGSLWIPILIIGFASIPYTTRPIRGESLSLIEKEFVEASIAQGAGPLRVMFGELLPNLASTIIVFFTLNVATDLLFESSLSFLGVGVQPPNSSWGTMIGLGFEQIYSDPLLTILPGAMIALTVLSLNVFGDCLRDALDPKSKIGVEAHSGIFIPEEEAA